MLENGLLDWRSAESEYITPFLRNEMFLVQISNREEKDEILTRRKTMSQQHMKARKRARRKQYVERVKARIAEKIAAKKK